MIIIANFTNPINAQEFRIISLAPNITEILFALDAGDQVVGVTDFCQYPPAATEKPRVGGLFNPNLEMMVALQPNLVIGLPASSELGEKLRSQNITFLVVKNETIDDIFDAIQQIGTTIKKNDEATHLINEIQTVITPTSPTSDSMSTMIVVGRNPGQLAGIYVAGKNTFLSELLERAGAKNIFTDIAGYYAEVSIEEIIRRDPKVIIELRLHKDQSKKKEILMEWEQFDNQLQAVKTNQVKIICEDYMTIPGPRLPLIFQNLKNALQSTNE